MVDGRHRVELPYQLEDDLLLEDEGAAGIGDDDVDLLLLVRTA